MLNPPPRSVRIKSSFIVTTCVGTFVAAIALIIGISKAVNDVNDRKSLVAHSQPAIAKVTSAQINHGKSTTYNLETNYVTQRGVITKGFETSPEIFNQAERDRVITVWFDPDNPEVSLLHEPTDEDNDVIRRTAVFSVLAALGFVLLAVSCATMTARQQKQRLSTWPSAMFTIETVRRGKINYVSGEYVVNGRTMRVGGVKSNRVYTPGDSAEIVYEPTAGQIVAFVDDLTCVELSQS